MDVDGIWLKELLIPTNTNMYLIESMGTIPWLVLPMIIDGLGPLWAVRK